MLSVEELAKIPRNTKRNWDRFKHINYYGFEMAETYINDFDHIKDVLRNKHLKSAMRFMCTMSNGYKNVISEIENNKQLVKKHKVDISNAISKIAKQGKLNISTACHLFGVNKNWFYRHRKKEKCTISKIGKCFKQHTSQLTYKEVSVIEDVVSNVKNFGKTKTTLYYSAIRDGVLACARSTFFKYADITGYQKLKKKPNKERKIGFRAKAVFEWLHIDVTFVQTQYSGVQKVAFVKDNFSKALLHYKTTSNSADSKFIRQLIEETFEKHKLLDGTSPINILTDGGSENKGAVLDWVDNIVAPPIVKKITAKTLEFPFSNSMSESTHSIYKTEYMKRLLSFDVEQHIKDLDNFMLYCNHERFPGDLYGYTTFQVLNGSKPDKNKFRDIIKEAQQNRLTENRAFNDCPILCF
jgi:hypothetical protein